MKAPDGCIDVKTAAERAGVKVQVVYRWMDRGDVRGVRQRSRRFVEVESLEEYLRPKPDGAA